MPEMSEEEFEIHYERLRKKKGWRRPKKRWTELTCKEWGLSCLITILIFIFAFACAFGSNIAAIYSR